MYYILLVWKYHQTTTAKRLEHMFVVEMTIYFQKPGALGWSRSVMQILGLQKRLEQITFGRLTQLKIVRVYFERNDFWWVYWWLGKDLAAEIVSKVHGIYDGPCVQVLQGESASFGYLRWYFCSCIGIFVAASAPLVRWT